MSNQHKFISRNHLLLRGAGRMGAKIYKGYTTHQFVNFVGFDVKEMI